MSAPSPEFSRRTWKYILNLFWILFPPVAINELLFGQRLPKVMLLSNNKRQSLWQRSMVPCPHCHTRHPALTWSTQNKTALGNWFGLYCPACGGVIPCLWNLTSLLMLILTFPLWIWFRKPLRNRWLRWQRARFRRPLNLETPGYNWVAQGLGWGMFMYLMMGLLYPLALREELTLLRITGSFFWWLAGGLIYGYVMKLFLRRKEKKQTRASL